MVKPEISLFGIFQVRLNNLPITQLESVKARALMVYLAAEAVHPQPCESLAALL